MAHTAQHNYLDSINRWDTPVRNDPFIGLKGTTPKSWGSFGQYGNTPPPTDFNLDFTGMGGSGADGLKGVMPSTWNAIGNTGLGNTTPNNLMSWEGAFGKGGWGFDAAKTALGAFQTYGGFQSLKEARRMNDSNMASALVDEENKARRINPDLERQASNLAAYQTGVDPRTEAEKLAFMAQYGMKSRGG